VTFIDLEGRSDGESIQKIVSQIKPRRLIIVRGSEDCSNILSDTVIKISDSKVFIPKGLEQLDVTTESHIYQVKMTDQLLSSLDFQQGKNAMVSK